MKKGKDKFEQYIEDNKSEFEADLDPQKSWNEIESSVEKTKTSTRNSIWFKAASVVLILLSSWLIYDRTQLNNQIEELQTLTYKNKAYEEIESFYQNDINAKSMRVNQLNADKKIGIGSDLDALHKNYNSLKNKAKKEGGHPELINALIQNLQMQQSILDQQLKILQEVQKYNNNENPENDEISI